MKSQALFCNEIECVLRDHELFVGGDKKDLDPGIIRGDDGLLSADLILEHVELDAEVAHVLTDELSHAVVVLADARREDDGIHAVHLGDVGADVELDLMREDLKSKHSSFVALFRGLFDVSEVGGDTGDAFYD